MIDKFKAAMRASVPLVAIETDDPASCITMIRRNMNGHKAVQWDFVRGLKGFPDDPSSEALAQDICSEDSTNPVQALAVCEATLTKVKDVKVIIFMHMIHRAIQADGVSQAIWNLRDVFKARSHMLVMLSPGMRLPDELKQDVVVLSDELPNKEEVGKIIDSMNKQAGVTITPEIKDSSADTLSGLSSFSAEQTYAMCLTRKGPDLPALWEAKCKAIEQTDGLSVFRGAENFASIGGIENAKSYARRIMEGRKAPVAILWLDELEKSLAGAKGDTSGTSQDQLGHLLTCMQDWDLPGMLLVGHPGTCKSAFAKAIGGEYGKPVVRGDLGAAKGSLVGESERKIRAFMKVYRSICNDQGMVIATCNKIDVLPPELRRRFYLALLMFDLPDAQEQSSIWPIWKRKYEITKEQDDLRPEQCEGWTGAEIRAVCNGSYRTGMKLSESKEYITPICKSAADQVEALRNLAHGRFISANKPGVYQKPSNNMPSGRALSV